MMWLKVFSDIVPPKLFFITKLFFQNEPIRRVFFKVAPTFFLKLRGLFCSSSAAIFFICAKFFMSRLRSYSVKVTNPDFSWVNFSATSLFDWYSTSFFYTRYRFSGILSGIMLRFFSHFNFLDLVRVLRSCQLSAWPRKEWRRDIRKEL